jgi:serine/threonine protein phosphatase 1
VRHTDHGGEWLYELPMEQQRRIGERLAALPMAMEVATNLGDVGLVHADFPTDDWKDIHRIDWSGIDRMHSIAGQLLWSAQRYRRRHTGIVKNIRALVHGHVTIPAMDRLGNVFFIDTGGWRRAGRFTFLELETLKPHVAPTVAELAIASYDD